MLYFDRLADVFNDNEIREESSKVIINSMITTDDVKILNYKRACLLEIRSKYGERKLSKYFK
jgi:hypothetical protein